MYIHHGSNPARPSTPLPLRDWALCRWRGSYLLLLSVASVTGNNAAAATLGPHTVN